MFRRRSRPGWRRRHESEKGLQRFEAILAQALVEPLKGSHRRVPGDPRYRLFGDPHHQSIDRMSRRLFDDLGLPASGTHNSASFQAEFMAAYDEYIAAIEEANRAFLARARALFEQAESTHAERVDATE